MRLMSLLLAIAPLLPAQDYQFQTLDAAGEAPSARIDGAIAYHADSRQIFLFGGRDSAFRNDLWAYTTERRVWIALRPTGGPPPARFGHTLIADARRGRLILFGGQASGFFSDTWSYDIANNRWTQLARDDAGPSRRYGHSAVYDAARDRMIISHGFTDAGRFDDTWAFDLARDAWRNISPPSGRPVRRCLHHAVADEAGGQMLLYGGCASGFGPCPLGDLWSFDLNTHQWTERTGAVKPPPRQWYGMGFDAERRALLLFSGSGERGKLADAWEYAPASNVWRAIATSALPQARERHEATYVPGLGVVYFGGSTDRGQVNELVALGVAAGPQVTAVVNAFSGDGERRSPGELVSIYGSGFAEGASVSVGGMSAPVLYSSPGQVNAQIPYEVPADGAGLVVTAGGKSSMPKALVVAPATPGLFSMIRVEDGEAVLWLTGFGVTDPPIATGELSDGRARLPVAALAVEIGGQPAEVRRAHLPTGTLGMLEVRIGLPPGTESGAAVVVKVGEATATARLP
jgi:uncharacterized protein (TIGR03437 family)